MWSEAQNVRISHVERPRISRQGKRCILVISAQSLLPDHLSLALKIRSVMARDGRPKPCFGIQTTGVVAFIESLSGQPIEER